MYVVTVKSDADIVVGHILKKILAADLCMILHRSGTIACDVTGSRRASQNIYKRVIAQNSSPQEICESVGKKVVQIWSKNTITCKFSVTVTFHHASFATNL